MSNYLNTILVIKDKQDRFYNAVDYIPSDAVKLRWTDKDGKMCFYHSSAHIMAEAILMHYPGALLTIGPPIENGFYYDIDFGTLEFNKEDIPKIEKSFLQIASKGVIFERRDCG